MNDPHAWERIALRLGFMGTPFCWLGFDEVQGYPLGDWPRD